MKNRSNRGSTLFAVLFFIVVLSAFAGAAFTFTSGTAGVSQRSTQMTLGYGVADATMELVYSRWRSIVASHTSKNLTSVVFTNPTSPYNSLGIDITKVLVTDLGFPSDYLGLPPTIADANALPGDTPAGTVTIQLVDVYGVPWTAPGDDIPNPGSQFKTAMAASNDFTAVNMIYDVQVKLSIPSRNGPVPIGIRRRFQRSNASAAQAAIFFENRLEIFPGTNMSVAGRVHTNDNLYQGTQTAPIDLEFVKKVTYSGANYNTNASLTTNIVGQGYVALGYRDTAFTDNQTGDPTRFQSGAPTQSSPMVVGGIDRQFLKPYNSTDNQNYNNNSLREIIERPVKRASADPSTASSTDFESYWDVPTTGDAAVMQASVESARLYNQASIKISLVYDQVTGLLDRAASTVRGQTPEGMADGPLLSAGDKTLILNTLNQSTGTKRVGVVDAREGVTVKTTTVNVGALKTAITSLTSLSGGFNGILYIADVTGQDPDTMSYNNGVASVANANGTDYETVTPTGGARVKHAIMLQNGSILPGSQIADTTDPLRAFTVATENAVYIKGDYNTGGIANNVPSNSGSPTADTFVPGYTPVTSAVMADAVAIVSSKFDPAAGNDLFYKKEISTFDPTKAMALNPITGAEVAPGTPGAVNQTTRAAFSTTVNTAVVSGMFENTDVAVGGGASNLLRYMENWSTVPAGVYDPDYTTNYSGALVRKAVTYNGSMMQSFYSKEFTAPWVGAGTGNYSAPKRIVRFDETFINKPPVGFPATITYVKGAWERLL